MMVRVRYAPSPTGLQHIGGVRTALFNYLFARAQGGAFVLRIEDTDQERYSEEALEDIYATFEWLGISWDEGPDRGGPYGPYFQSQRLERYHKAVRSLLDAGKAYECFCSAERLAGLRSEGARDGVVGYDRRCRNLDDEQRAAYRAEGITPVVRLKVPDNGAASFEDLLLGTVKRKYKDLSPDPIILKSDGFPTYHLANVVDDHEMEISHVLRAQEWLSSTPLHILLYEAFGYEPPRYCHLPFVTGKDGQKLSKRHGATSVVEFRKQGYLPEALTNYIALLGWSYDDSREFFTLRELEQLFSIEKLNKAPAVFDYKKLEWFNGNYIRDCSDERLFELMRPYLEAAELLPAGNASAGGATAAGESRRPGPGADESHEADVVRNAVPLVRERLKLLSEAPELLRFLLADVTGNYDAEELIPKKMDAQATEALLQAVRPVVAAMEQYDDEQLEAEFRRLAERHETKLGNVMMPLRVAITGSRTSPPLIGSLRLLGTDRALARVDAAIAKL